MSQAEEADTVQGARLTTAPRSSAAAGAVALLRACWCRLKWRVLRQRFRAGRNFRVYGSIEISGPGQVIFGDDVAVVEHARARTYAVTARILVGNNVLIGSTRFGCAVEIEVGDGCQLAEAYIMDTDFHSTREDRRTDRAPIRCASVRIGRNVWVAHGAGILPGAHIGDNSVVSFGAVCARDYPPNVILMGNPARAAAPIPRIDAPVDGVA